MLINAGIKEIIISDGYPDEMAKGFLKEAKIKIRQISHGLASNSQSHREIKSKKAKG